MRRILMGLAALFALSTVPAAATAEEGAEKPAAEKKEGKKKKGKKKEKAEGGEKKAE